MTSIGVEVTFWAALGLISYGYFGYPALMWAIARWRPRPTRIDPSYRPTVSLIIAACNEEKTIREKLENTFGLLYPRARLDIVVAADGSNDATTDIVSEYAARGVRLLHRPERQGKSAAIARAVATCSSEIILFSDANTHYSPEAILKLVRHFADSRVGGVSGRKIVLSDLDRAATQGELAFWSYESSLKEWESAVGSIATADGEIFAMRRELFEGLPAEIVHDDMYLTLKMVEAGYRVVYERAATSGEYASKTLFDEFHLKVRYASAGYQIIARFSRMFVPIPTWFGLGFLSHKLLRWIAPLLLAGTFISSAFLTAWPFYGAMFWLQVAFYGAAFAGLVMRRWVTSGILYFPLYFSVMNAAAFYGLVRYFVAGQSPVWRKAAR
jgi:cellulose synthase/poly-beta-1,6-N-acetylglucosamine synthase-like glycosyltransferase